LLDVSKTALPHALLLRRHDEIRPREGELQRCRGVAHPPPRGEDRQVSDTTVTPAGSPDVKGIGFRRRGRGTEKR
jgi:hypothetical protein